MSSTTNEAVESMTMEELRKELETYRMPTQGFHSLEKEELVKVVKLARDLVACLLLNKMQQNPKCSCFHGARHHAKLLDVFDKVIKDFRQFRLSPVGNHEKKEIWVRMLKTHIFFRDEEGNSLILKEVYSYCTFLILSGNIEEARKVCIKALIYEMIGLALGDPESRMSKIPQAFSTILTDQQLMVHVSKRIPCKCLHKKRKELGLREATAKCANCHVINPCNRMFQCSHCNVWSYCSEECQKRAWKEHKKNCKKMCDFNDSYQQPDARTQLHDLGYELGVMGNQLEELRLSITRTTGKLTSSQLCFLRDELARMDNRLAYLDSSGNEGIWLRHIYCCDVSSK